MSIELKPEAWIAGAFTCVGAVSGAFFGWLGKGRAELNSSRAALKHAQVAALAAETAAREAAAIAQKTANDALTRVLKVVEEERAICQRELLMLREEVMTNRKITSNLRDEVAAQPSIDESLISKIPNLQQLIVIETPVPDDMLDALKRADDGQASPS